MAKKGHNLVITGQAGTGKTLLLKALISALESDGKTVSVVATTGMAATLLPHATTLHRLCGLKDGRFSTKELIERFEVLEELEDRKNKIIATDVLILDEVSMLSRHFLEQVEALFRTIKQSSYLFGDVQLIFAGDFYQLPPVPNPSYGDAGEHCFTSPIWAKLFGHFMVLEKVYRQTDHALIQAVHDLSKGKCSPASLTVINSLKRPLKTAAQVKLFATNGAVDKENSDRLLEMEGK
jgi:ATP-dependent DNA helicase PIF1